MRLDWTNTRKQYLIISWGHRQPPPPHLSLRCQRHYRSQPAGQELICTPSEKKRKTHTCILNISYIQRGGSQRMYTWAKSCKLLGGRSLYVQDKDVVLVHEKMLDRRKKTLPCKGIDALLLATCTTPNVRYPTRPPYPQERTKHQLHFIVLTAEHE